MANENVIQATFDGFYKTYTKPSWLIDHGMELSISGIDLPDEFECHFSNSRSVAAKRQIGENGVVTIPDEYFLSNAAQIFCWIYLHPTVDSGVTEYEIVIPLLTRPNVDPAEPTQEQQDIVDQAIAALNAAVEQTGQDVEDANNAAESARESADAFEGMIAEEYDENKTYTIGDYSIHNDVLYRCITAITTAEAWTAAHWTAVTLGDDVADLKSALDAKFPVKPYNTVFFDGANYFDPLFADYIDGGLAINASGELFPASANAKSLVIPVEPNTQYSLFIPDGNRQYIGEKATNDFASGQTIAMLVTANADYPCTFTTGVTANYILVYFNSGSYDYDTKKNQIKLCKGDVINNGYPTLNSNYLGMIPESKLDIFKGTNLFSSADTIYRTDRNINTTTGVIFTSTTAKSITFPVEPNTRYSIFVPDGNRSAVAEGTDSSFAIGSTKTVLVSDATLAYPIEFTTGATAKFVFIVINVGDYDYENKKSGIKLFKGKYWNRPMPYLPMANMDEEINNLYGLNVLIFGDSITDCCNFTINADNETTAYSWKNPSNSYIDAGGNPIAYSMWPKILKDTQPLGEIRNYALSGASVRSEQRTAGNERLNLQYQVDLAINDLDNPNHAFAIDNFVPDIVVFAIGTNDVTPNDTYDSAMSVVTYLSDGVSVNVDATMAQLDPTKFCESARLAFLKIRKLFPMTQIYYYLPLQRARYQQNTTTLHTELEKMAKRYGCIIIDGTFESGIIAEFEQVGHLGALLKDGLHPNEKGQNLMARQILASIKSHYMPFEFGFNK